MKRKLLILPVLLLISSCTIAGMDRIPHYELISIAIAIAACFVMALGFAMVETLSTHRLEHGGSRSKAALTFAVTMLVFIILLTVACSGSVTADLEEDVTIECSGWHIAVGDYVLYDSYTCDDSEYHYQMMLDRKMDLLIEQGDAIAYELFRLEVLEEYHGS